jgi:imidazolonepropionase-like amidohydrolase
MATTRHPCFAAATVLVAGRGRVRWWLALLCLAAVSHSELAAAQRVDSLAPQVRKYLAVSTPKVVLEHVQIIDGTGGPPRPDQNIDIEDGKIAGISPGADRPAGDGTTILDLRGYTVMLGIVGMHNHLFYLARPNQGPDGSYDSPALFQQMSFSAPRLYLANGVTTLRTAGSVEPYTDLKLKRAIEGGTFPGPHLDVTGPYLDGPGGNLQMPELSGPEDARQTVNYWADRGVTSFKAYAHITREELSAAVRAAHQRGLKVTGHLCSVTYEEAISIGIDNLEHGFSANTGQDPDKKPDVCSASGGDYTLEHMIPGGADATRLIAMLIQHHVAITSTLPGAASTLPGAESTEGRPTLRPAALQSMSPAVRDAYLFSRNRPQSPAAQANTAGLLRREMDLERTFVAAGGLLLAGPDPVGVNGLIPGFGDQREIELLVEAGFTAVQAIQIATLNGAIFLGRQDRIGSIALGKSADLVVMKGDPVSRIADIENVDLVFKDGAGYDTHKLLESVKGRYGEY